MKLRALCTMLSFVPLYLFSQGVTIGSNNPPDGSAILDLQSVNKGLLLPRMTTSQRNAINAPAVGLTIYNTTTTCVESFFPGGWKSLGCDCNQFPSSVFNYAPGSPSIGQSVNFTCNDPGPTYSWSFQGGSPAVSSAQNPVVSWAQPGTYQVILQVTNSGGCSDIDTQTVVVSNCSYVPGSITFQYTGSPQNFTVPTCVNSINIQARGAQGWSGSNTGGLGGLATGTYIATPGQLLYVYVGGQGTVATGANIPMGGGWNGGGHGQSNSSGAYVGGGGGASDVRAGGQALSNRIIVAGGGGGSTNNSNAYGGHGGGLTGTDGGQHNSYHYGKGGTQSMGGDSGGSLGQGGNAQNGMIPWNGGGGGGYYGGGVSTEHSGGGGGSSYIGGVTNGTTQTGVQSGNGQVVISW